MSDTWTEQHSIDLLIHNAGVMYTPKRTIADGFELQYELHRRLAPLGTAIAVAPTRVCLTRSSLGTPLPRSASLSGG